VKFSRSENQVVYHLKWKLYLHKMLDVKQQSYKNQFESLQFDQKPESLVEWRDPTPFREMGALKNFTET